VKEPRFDSREPFLISSAQSPDVLLNFMGAPPMGTPFVPCWDFSGVIHSVGAGVKDYSAGDEVFGMIPNMTGAFIIWLC
jgi:NADPH:quinone reductase-like Zn-dependent oxidoreductase